MAVCFHRRRGPTDDWPQLRLLGGVIVPAPDELDWEMGGLRPEERRSFDANGESDQRIGRATCFSRTELQKEQATMRAQSESTVHPRTGGWSRREALRGLGGIAAGALVFGRWTGSSAQQSTASP